ncbi:MAG: hypothetical protein FWG78_00005, partial [Coriobacteriia bacterium]|nr:hypothetical protein [Coriobacteriia bacterium]
MKPEKLTGSAGAGVTSDASSGATPDTDAPRSRKRQNTTIAVIIALLLLLFGAFAWGTIQRAVNQFARAALPEARLHDVFTREAEDTWHKEVWVQNTGNVPFIARIQAKEFMQWLQDGGTDGSNMLNEYLTTAQDSRIPIPFAPLNTSNTDAMDAMAATLLESGWGTNSLIDTDTANPWFVIPSTSWTNHGTTWDDPPPAPATPDPFGKYWEWGSSGAGPTRTDLSVSVMTFAQWDASRPADTWVLCEDGFFYYSSAVDPDTDTALLMNTVSYNNARLRSEAFYYAIDLTMEVVSQEDADAMRYGADPFEGGESPWTMQAAGPNGREVINHIWPLEGPPIGGFSITINGISEDFSNTDRLVEVIQNDTVTFEVNAISTGDPLYYQWQLENSWTDISGATNVTYSPPTTTVGSENYRVLVSTESDPAERDASNTTVSAVITVEVEALPTPPVPTPVIPTRRDFGPVQFFRIAEATVGGVTYDLLVTRYVYGATPTAAWANVLFNASGQGNFWLTNEAGTGQSTVIAGMDSWYNGLTGAGLDSGTDNLKSLAVQADFTGSNAGAGSTRTFGTEGLTGHPSVTALAGTTNADVAANIAFMQNPENYPDAISMPSSRAAANPTSSSPSTGQGVVAFPLSGKEILSYFTNIGTNTFTEESVLAPRAYGIAANHAGSTTTRSWWSRSRGGAAATAGSVNNGGDVYGSWGGL